MLNSVVGMVDKVRHAVNMLRERALNSNADFEKKEVTNPWMVIPMVCFIWNTSLYSKFVWVKTKGQWNTATESCEAYSICHHCRY